MVTFLNVFLHFLKVQKTWLFTFFEMLHTFSQTLHNSDWYTGLMLIDDVYANTRPAEFGCTTKTTINRSLEQAISTIALCINLEWEKAPEPSHFSKPSPVNPGLQRHLNVPITLVQLPFLWQTSGFLHSSTSAQKKTFSHWLNSPLLVIFFSFLRAVISK